MHLLIDLAAFCDRFVITYESEREKERESPGTGFELSRKRIFFPCE